jgi:hypothetical protein
MRQPSKPRTPRPRTAPAPAPDQVDVLVGMLLEQARLMHAMFGGDPMMFDFDATRGRFYALAEAPVGTNSSSDRYRSLTRRGIHSSRSTAVDNPVDA